MLLLNKQTCVSAILSLVLTACASLPDEKSIQTRAQSSGPLSNSSSDSLQKAKLQIKKSESEMLNFYAPSYHAKALQAFEKAKSMYSENSQSKDVKLNAQLAFEFINAGMRNKKIVKDALKKSLNNRSILIELSANKHFPLVFKDLENEHIKIIQTIEQRDLESAKTAEKSLIKKMRALEVKTIDHTYLSKTHTMLEQAKALDAKTLLANTYTETINNLADTQQFIRQNPRQELRIEELAKASLFQAERLYSLTRYAKQMKLAQKEQLEQFILKQEEQLQRINSGFEEPDIRNMSLNDQSLVLQKLAEQSVLDIRSYQSKGGKVSKAQLDKWKRKTVLLQAEVRRLQKAIKSSQDRN